jgi:hypothetical protein
MKSRLATVLSLAGVLVAGSAAALVNTQVLEGGGGSTAAAAPEVLATTTSTEPPPTVDDPSTSTTTTSAAPADEAQGVSSPVSTQAVYQIGDAGTVTLDTEGNVLRIVGAAPAAGWTVKTSENTDPLGVKVVFRSGDVEVEFGAKLVSGVVVTSVRSSRVGAPTATVAPSGTTYHGDDDDHDDDSGHHDDDEHEEEGDD